MKIQLSDHVALNLMTIANITEGLEFSGFGYVEVKDDTIMVYDVVILDIGNEVFTEIAPSNLISLMDRSDARNLKLWIHRHPLGNGIPGKRNWSSTDERTIVETPLGGHPDLVKWSCSIVLTPRGWVGRIDNHVKNITQHIEVVPQCKNAYDVCKEISTKKSAKKGFFLHNQQFSENWDEIFDQFDKFGGRRVLERSVGSRRHCFRTNAEFTDGNI